MKSLPLKSFRGLNNVLKPENTDSSFLKKAMNIDIDRAGRIQKRKGYHLIDSGDYTSLWSSANGLGCYGVKDQNLVRIHDDLTIEIIEYLVGPSKLSFEEVNDTIYWISEEHKGRIVSHRNLDWGIPKQTSVPSVLISTGALPKGSYQIAISFIRDDGLESGVGVAQIVNIDNDGASIVISLPDTDAPDIHECSIYCSSDNGKELYFSGKAPKGSTYTFDSTDNLVNICRLFNLDEPPLGHIVRYIRGRLYIAQGNVLWYSEPYQYEHFRLHSNYIEYPAFIREILPTEDGMWIASDQLYYISGTDPEKFTQVSKDNSRVIPGTALNVNDAFIKTQNVPKGNVWVVTANTGILALFNQGVVENLTMEKVSMGDADEGSAVFMQENGNNQYLTMLKPRADTQNSVVGDMVEATIIRNGIAIP